VPREEVRGALVAAGPDDQVDVADRSIVQPLLDGFDVDIGRVEVARIDVACDRRRRVEQFGAATVRQRDVQREPVVVGGAALCVVHRVAHALREAVDIADCANADSLLMDAVGVGEVAELGLQQVEQRLQLLVRALEVLGREGVQRQLCDAQIRAPVEDALGGSGAGPVAVGRVVAAPGRTADFRPG